MVGNEGDEVAPRVGHEPDFQAVRTELCEDRQRVLEELEVRRLLPTARHLDRALVGAVGVAAHAANDPLSEEHPDLLVVVELRVPLDRLDRGGARLRVSRGVELEPEPPSEQLIAVRAQVGPRLDEREVDVEEDGFEHYPACSSQRAVSTCDCWISEPKLHAIV